MYVEDISAMIAIRGGTNDYTHFDSTDPDLEEDWPYDFVYVTKTQTWQDFIWQSGTVEGPNVPIWVAKTVNVGHNQYLPVYVEAIGGTWLLAPDVGITVGRSNFSDNWQGDLFFNGVTIMSTRAAFDEELADRGDWGRIRFYQGSTGLSGMGNGTVVKHGGGATGQSCKYPVGYLNRDQGKLCSTVEIGYGSAANITDTTFRKNNYYCIASMNGSGDLTTDNDFDDDDDGEAACTSGSVYKHNHKEMSN
jgi:hypothetical protein